MNHRRLAVFWAIVCFWAVETVYGQTQHFNPISGTGENATLVLPASTNPTIDGVLLAGGDELGVFTQGGLNVGAGAWNDENLAITFWGDDSVTPEIDGMVSGDTILIRVWDESADRELQQVLVTYAEGNGLYEADAILSLATLEAHTSLPVELADLRAALDGRDVLLNWRTLSESNNAGFEIEYLHENDPLGWVKVGFVSGRGTSIEDVVYSYRISELRPGSYSFRLRQIDLDGSFNLSSVVDLFIPDHEGALLQPAYPNPSTSVATIGFFVPREETITLSLLDPLGRVVRLLHSGMVTSGRHHVQVDTATLPAGVYFYRLRAGDSVETRRMVVAR